MRVTSADGAQLGIMPTREALRMAESCLARGLSFDVGLMQINSYWIRRYRIPLRRLFHPRDNIYVACFILAGSMRRDGPT